MGIDIANDSKKLTQSNKWKKKLDNESIQCFIAMYHLLTDDSTKEHIKVTVAQWAQQLLPKSEISGLNPVIDTFHYLLSMLEAKSFKLIIKFDYGGETK